MRILTSLTLFFIVLFNGSCQNDTSFIPIAAYWETGDTLNFRITKVKRKWEDRKLTLNDSSSYNSRFRVVNSDSTSYTIEWKFDNNFFELFGLADSTGEKFPSYQNIVVLYKTDQFGAFTGIENWQEISRMINNIISELIRLKSRNEGINIDEVTKSFEPLLSVYNTRRGIEQLVFKELLIMHFPFGKQYKRGEIYNYTEQIPVMVNSDPAIGNGIIFVRLANSDKQRCEIVQRMKILPDSAKKMLRNYFQTIGMRREAIGSTVESSVLEVNEENIYDYYYYPGIPVRVSTMRETRINVLEDKIKQTDQTLIELIVP